MLLLNPLPQRLDSGATPTFAGLLAGDGTAAAPSISFASATGNGFWKRTSAITAYSSGGTISLGFGANGQIFGAGDQQIVGASTGGWGIVAGGTNQNITLTPSGTGEVSISSDIYLTGATKSIKFFTSGADYVGQRVSANKVKFDGGTVFPTDGFEFYTASSVGLKIIPGGKALLNTIVDSGALLQIGTNTTDKTGGIAFGTDTFLYRVFAYQLNFGDATSNAMFNYDAAAAATCATIFKKAGTEIGRIGVAPSGTSLLLATGANVTALTLDASQAATFSAAAGATFVAKFNHVGGTNPVVLLQEGGVSKAQWSSFSGDVYFDSLTAGKSVVFRSGAQVTALTLDSAQRTILSGALRLANAYVAGAVVGTGYVTIQDSTGTTYRIPVLV